MDSSYLSTLGVSRLRRFKHIGELFDINASISNLLQVVWPSDDGHPDKPVYLSNLGLAQQCRFERIGELSDIITSIMNLLATGSSAYRQRAPKKAEVSLKSRAQPSMSLRAYWRAVRYPYLHLEPPTGSSAYR
jgi:hypothetical protein